MKRLVCRRKQGRQGTIIASIEKYTVRLGYLSKMQ